VCLQYSMKRSHVVESGNLWAVVNELYEWFRDQIEPGQPLVLSVHPQAMAWMITGDHEDERAVKIVRKTLKDAIAFGFIELVYPRTRPLSYRWLGAVVDGEIRPNMEAWHRECAKTVAKLAQERRLRSVKNKYERLAWNMRLSRKIIAQRDMRTTSVVPNNSESEGKRP